MDFELKVLSRSIQEALYDSGESIGTAESCTSGRIAEALSAISGASNYFKGGIVSYATEVKENILHVNHDSVEQFTVVSEQVATEMVKGACDALNTTYAIAATGVAGPTGGTTAIPTGTIWLAYGTKDDIRTYKLTEDNGRDKNLSNATKKALQLFLAYIGEKRNGQEAAAEMPSGD